MNAARLGTVGTYLFWYHDHLGQTLAKAAELFERGDLAGALEAHRRFDEALSRHVRAEEEILFPAFERSTSAAAGPTAIMRKEHRAIESEVRRLGQALEAGDAEAFEGSLAGVRAVLRAHNAREETVLYPMTDGVLTTAEIVDLVSSQKQT